MSYALKCYQTELRKSNEYTSNYHNFHTQFDDKKPIIPCQTTAPFCVQTLKSYGMPFRMTFKQTIPYFY